MRPNPTWQDLPFQFKQGVVTYLNFKTRRSLEKCSKSDQSVVRSVPLILSSLLLDLSPDDNPAEWNVPHYTDSSPDIEKTQLLVSERPFSRGIHWKTVSEERTIETLKQIFRNPKVIIKEMIFTIDGNPARFIRKLIANWGNLKFHVEKLIWTSCKIAKNQKEMENCLRFFSLFDSGTLKKLELNFNNKQKGGLIGEMMKMDQFQGLVEEIFIRSEVEIEKLEMVFHSKRVKIQLEEVRAEDLKRAIEIFQTKTLGSYFKFSTNEVQIDLDKIIKVFQTMPNNCSVPTNQLYERDTKTHRFEILDRKSEKGEALVFCMKIQKNNVWGAVCRADHIAHDLNKCSYY